MVVPERSIVQVDPFHDSIAPPSPTALQNVADAQLTMSGISRLIIQNQEFDKIVERRRTNYRHLQSLLEDISPPVFPDLPEGVCPLFFPFATRRKRELCERLHVSGVEAVPFWLHGEFSPPRGAFPEVDVLRDTVLELPCHQDLQHEDIERLGETVRSVMADMGES